MLREELQNRDIPSRTTMRDRIMEMLDTHLDNLERDMHVRHSRCRCWEAWSHFCSQQKSVGRVSFTMDMWTDTDLSPFMAVTAHWIQGTTERTPNGCKTILKLRADLVGFYHVPDRHDGRHLAHSFLFITDRLDITEKVCYLAFCSFYS